MAVNYQLAKFRVLNGVTPGARYDLAKFRVIFDNSKGIFYELAKFRAVFTALPPLNITMGQEQHLSPFATVILAVIPQFIGDNVYDADTYVFQQLNAAGGIPVAFTHPLTIDPLTPWVATWKAPALFTSTTNFYRVTVTRAGVVAVAELKCVVAPHAGFFTPTKQGIEIRTS